MSISQAAYEGQIMAILDLQGEVRALRAALLASVGVIQTWHNMELSGKDASQLWDIYWRNAPEMKPIREALLGLKEAG